MDIGHKKTGLLKQDEKLKTAVVIDPACKNKFKLEITTKLVDGKLVEVKTIVPCVNRLQ
jgi:hypothetical protein